jgi:putative transposase
MDHDAQYLWDHFQNRLKPWGISPSFALSEPPQTHGVAERSIRTLKEQVIYGRVFRNLQEEREAVRHLVAPCNREWLMEKNGCKSPWQARAPWLAQAALAWAA